MNQFRSRDPHDEYLEAMRRVKTAMRGGQLNVAKEWLQVAERCMRVHNRYDAMLAADDKRQARRAEHPHRMRWLELRARFPR